jgi:hypothetical protein
MERELRSSDPKQTTKAGRRCSLAQKDINMAVRKSGKRTNIATERALVYKLDTHHFRNALKKSSEWKCFADLAVFLMAMSLVEVDNERIFSLNCGIIGTHATCTGSELVGGPARIKIQNDIIQSSRNQSHSL